MVGVVLFTRSNSFAIFPGKRILLFELLVNYLSPYWGQFFLISSSSLEGFDFSIGELREVNCLVEINEIVVETYIIIGGVCFF